MYLLYLQNHHVFLNENEVSESDLTDTRFTITFPDDSKPGIWAAPLSLLTKHNKALADFEMEIVQDNKDRLERLFNLCKEKGCITDSYAHVLLDEAELLADYYKNKKQQDCILEVLDKALVGIHFSFKLKHSLYRKLF